MATFGKETIGVNSGLWGGGRIVGTRFTALLSGLADSITVYTGGFGGSALAKCAIYRYSDGALLGITEEKTITTTEGWWIFNFISKPPISLGERYTLALWTNNSRMMFYDSGGQSLYSEVILYDDFPDPWPSYGSQGREYSIYCTYTPTEGYADITELLVHNDTTGMMYEYAPGGPFGDWIPSDPEGTEADLMRVYVEVTNIGVDNNLKTELTGDVVGSDEFFLGAGLIHASNFSFTMPNHDVNITVNTSHLE